MPIHIQYLEDNGVVLQGEGIITFEDFKEANAYIYSSKENIKAINYQITDLSAIETVNLSNEELEEVAQQDHYAFTINPDIRIAVVGPEDLTLGLARVWDAYACQMDSDHSCEIFRNREDALEWIAQSKQLS